ncbi:YbjQ family protein [Euzebya tangerina]|uniref:YbjQ family protein n=1 Tax=Euzebya tangerina TaxID=591198 RepID=UPI000E31083F|nr:heavy metal-binding domain-containing protein [Euzebya tangerina]
MEFVLSILILALLVGIGFLVGSWRERRHLAELAQREQAMAHVLVTDLRSLPLGLDASAGTMVMGEVVIASDYFKQFAAQLRNLVGGEVTSFRTVMDRGRREARQRMVEQADRIGARTVINVRFETSTVAALGTEVLCYGTAVR